MLRINYVILSGNVIRDTEVRFTKEGKPVTIINFAVGNDYKSKTTNEWVRQPCYVDITIWKEIKYAKGTPIIVAGELDMQQWETQDGQKRTKLLIKAKSIWEIVREKKEEVEKIQEEIPF